MALIIAMIIILILVIVFIIYSFWPIILLITIGIITFNYFKNKHAEQQRLELLERLQTTSICAMNFLSNKFSKNVSGVYILHNKCRGVTYVGQSTNVKERAKAHLNGLGHRTDLYSHFIRGDRFTVKIIKFEGSGFKTLNELERYYINLYDSFYNGYNRTRGNVC